jgi:hypothetical protein
MLTHLLALALGACAQPATTDQPVTADAAAQVEPEPTPGPFDRDPSRWEFSFEPSVWFVGASGTVRLPRSVATGAPTSSLVLEDLNLDNPNFQPLIELNARRGDWRGTLRGASFGAERNATGLSGSLGDLTFAAGDTVRTDLEMTIIEVEAAYTFAGSPREKQSDGSYAVDPRLDAVVGLRAYHSDWSVANLSATSGVTSVDESGWYLQPQVGLKLSADLYTELTLDTQLTLGAMPEADNYSLDIVVGIQWRPAWNVGVQAGYRSLFFGMSEGDGETDFSFDGSLQGLYGGVVVRF